MLEDPQTGKTRHPHVTDDHVRVESGSRGAAVQKRQKLDSIPCLDDVIPVSAKGVRHERPEVIVVVCHQDGRVRGASS
jgi:hypothetical protein